MKKILSIDLETLDTTTTAVILEIGIAVGDTDGNVIEEFQMFPDIQEQINEGRTVSGSTILWWMKQDEAILGTQHTASRFSLEEVRAELESFLWKHSPGSYVLGNAPSFDCDILSDFLGKKLWPFWVERDVRTARMKVPQEERAPNHAEHCASADALAQYHDFVTFLKK